MLEKGSHPKADWTKKHHVDPCHQAARSCACGIVKAKLVNRRSGRLRLSAAQDSWQEDEQIRHPLTWGTLETKASVSLRRCRSCRGRCIRLRTERWAGGLDIEQSVF